MNKKANLFALIMFIFFIMIAIFAIFAMTIGSGILTYVSGEITGITNELGMVGSSNLSRYSEVSIGTANTSIQMLSWGAGVISFALILAILIFAAAIKQTPNKLMMAIFILMNILLIMTAIYISNIYEEVYNGTDVLALELQSMTMASWIVLYLPGILTAVAFIGGIIIFTGIGEEFV